MRSKVAHGSNKDRSTHSRSPSSSSTNVSTSTISFLPYSLIEQWFLANDSSEYESAILEITEIYRKLAPIERHEAGKDLPKMLRILNMNSYNTVPVNAAILTLMELLLNDHADVFVSELHSMFSRLQLYISHENKSLTMLALRFMGLLVTKVPFALTEHFIYSTLKDEKNSYPEIALQLAALALLNSEKSNQAEYNPMISLVSIHDSEEYNKAMVIRIAKIAYSYLRGNQIYSTSSEKRYMASIDVCTSALLRLHPFVVTTSSEDVVNALFSDIIGENVSANIAGILHQRSSQLFFPSLLRESATTEIVASLIASKHHECTEIDMNQTERRTSIEELQDVSRTYVDTKNIVHNESSANSREVLNETETDSKFYHPYNEIENRNAYHQCEKLRNHEERGSLSERGGVSFMMGVENNEKIFGFYSPSAMKPSPSSGRIGNFGLNVRAINLKGDETDKYSKLPKDVFLDDYDTSSNTRTASLHRTKNVGDEQSSPSQLVLSKSQTFKGYEDFSDSNGDSPGTTSSHSLEDSVCKTKYVETSGVLTCERVEIAPVVAEPSFIGSYQVNCVHDGLSKQLPNNFTHLDRELSPQKMIYSPSWSIEESTGEFDTPIVAKEKLKRTPPFENKKLSDLDFSKLLANVHTTPNEKKELHDVGENDFFAMRISANQKIRARKLVKPSWKINAEDELVTEDEFDRSKLSSIKKYNGRVRKSAPMRFGVDSTNTRDVNCKRVPSSSNGSRHIKLDETPSDFPTNVSKFKSSISKGICDDSIQSMEPVPKVQDISILDSNDIDDDGSYLSSSKSFVHHSSRDKASILAHDRDCDEIGKNYNSAHNSNKIENGYGLGEQPEGISVDKPYEVSSRTGIDPFVTFHEISNENKKCTHRNRRLKPTVTECNRSFVNYRSYKKSDGSSEKIDYCCNEDEIEKNGDSANIVLIRDEEYTNEYGVAEYLLTEDVPACTRPEKDLNVVVQALPFQKWPKIFGTINTVRSLALHHGDLVTVSGSLHLIVTSLMKLVDNLRSTVAKNAILAVGDLFLGLKKGMDSEVTATCKGLSKKYGDANMFLGECARDALMKMIENVTAARALAGLLSVVDSKTGEIRGKVASLLSQLVLSRGEELAGTREFMGGLLKLKLEQILSDKDPEARAYAREILENIMMQNLVGNGRLLESFIPTSVIEKSMKERDRDKLKERYSKWSPSRLNSSPLRKRSSRVVNTAVGNDSNCHSCDFLPSATKTSA